MRPSLNVMSRPFNVIAILLRCQPMNQIFQDANAFLILLQPIACGPRLVKSDSLYKSIYSQTSLAPAVRWSRRASQANPEMVTANRQIHRLAVYFWHVMPNSDHSKPHAL